MKLKALDQVSITAVKSGLIQPGEEFEISDAAGQDLLDKRPDDFEKMPEPKGAKAKEDDVKSEIEPINIKATPGAPQNKAEPAAPKNKGGALFGDTKPAPADDEKADDEADPKRS
jgi:hypothetical protein